MGRHSIRPASRLQEQVLLGRMSGTMPHREGFSTVHGVHGARGSAVGALANAEHPRIAEAVPRWCARILAAALG